MTENVTIGFFWSLFYLRLDCAVFYVPANTV